MLFYGFGLMPQTTVTATSLPTRLITPNNPTPPPPNTLVIQTAKAPSTGTFLPTAPPPPPPPSTGGVQPVSTSGGGSTTPPPDSGGLLPYTDPNGVTCLQAQVNMATGYCPGSTPPQAPSGDGGSGVCPSGTQYDPSVGGCTSTGPATVDTGGGPTDGGSSLYTDPNGVSCDPSQVDPSSGLCPGSAPATPAGPTVTVSPIAPVTASPLSNLSTGSKIALAVLGLGAAGLGIAAIGRRSRRAA